MELKCLHYVSYVILLLVSAGRFPTQVVVCDLKRDEDDEGRRAGVEDMWVCPV